MSHLLLFAHQQSDEVCHCGFHKHPPAEQDMAQSHNIPVRLRRSQLHASYVGCLKRAASNTHESDRVQLLSTTDLPPEERRRRGAQAAAKTRERNQREERARRTQAIMDANNRRTRRLEEDEEDDDLGETDLAAPEELGNDSDARPLFEAKKKRKGPGTKCSRCVVLSSASRYCFDALPADSIACLPVVRL